MSGVTFKETFTEILHRLEEAHVCELQNLSSEIDSLRRQTSSASILLGPTLRPDVQPCGSLPVSSLLGPSLRPDVPEKPPVPAARESNTASIEALHEAARCAGDEWSQRALEITGVISQDGAGDDWSQRALEITGVVSQEVTPWTPTHRPSLYRAQTTDTSEVDQGYRQAALRTSCQMVQQKSEALDICHSEESKVMPSKLHLRIAAIVESYHFEVFFAVAILSNSLSMGIRADMHGDEPVVLQFMEYAYTILFTIELLLRLKVDGFRAFFLPKMMLWYYLDLFVVVTSLLEMCVEFAVNADDGDGSPSNDLANMSNVRMFRVLRVIRIVKVIRVARLVRFIRALRKLVLSIAHTLRTVMWACALLVMIIYIFALTIVQAVHAHTDLNNQSIPDLQYYWGSLPRSMLTLYMVISDGISWILVVEPLVEVSGWLMVVFIIYVSFTIFAVLNVITGVFCEAALESARQDYELMIQTHLEERDTFTEAVYAAFGVEKKDGEELQMSYREFEDVFNNPQTKAYLAALELNSADAWELFKLLDTDASALIDVDEFVNGCLRLKGMAKAIDIAKLSYEQKIRQKRLHRFMTDVEKKLDAMHITQAECLLARNRSL